MTAPASSPAAPTATPARAQDIAGATASMMVALVSFSLIGIAGREASRVVTTAELMFWRGMIGTLVLVVILRAAGQVRPQILSQQPWLHGVRATVHFGAQFSWLYAVTLIPLAQLFALEFTAPLWVALLAPLLLGERLTATRLAAAVIGFIGTLIVVRPGVTGLSTGAAFALASALGFALSMICTKRLLRTDTPLCIIFWMHVLQTAIAAVALLYTGVTWPDPWTWMWIAIVGLAGLAAHFSLARAFSLADAIIVAPMDFLRVPLIAIVGALAYGEALNPWVLGGGAVILIANTLNIWGERRRR